MPNQYSAFAQYLPPAPLVEAWGDLIDLRQEQRDEWQQLGWGNGPGYSTGRSDDRRAGMLRPIFETEQDLDDIRAIARVLAETTAPGVSSLLNLTNYVVGTGFSYRVTPEPGVDNEELRKAVQAVVDDFLDRNNWCGEMERELFRRSRRDGEYFLSMFCQEGAVDVRIIDPERVRDPQQVPPMGRSYSFGVDTDADDVQKRDGYWVFYDSLDGAPDYLKAGMVQHVKLNVDSNIKRGVSDFFPIGSEIGNVRKLLANMVKGGGIQAAIAYICEHASGVTGTQIEALVQTNATMKTTVQNYNTGTRTRYVNDEKGGTRLDVGKGQTYKGSPLGNGEAANAFIAILQAGLRSIGSRWAMPEYMISGDASNANYASTKEAGTPFVKNCEVEQAQYTRRFAVPVWLAIKEACRVGRISASYEEVCGQMDLQVEPPAIIVTDPKAETERRAVLKREGILSPKTWSDQEGLDYEHEQANGAKAAAQQQPVGGQPSQTASFPESLMECGGKGGKPGPCPQGTHEWSNEIDAAVKAKRDQGFGSAVSDEKLWNMTAADKIAERQKSVKGMDKFKAINADIGEIARQRGYDTIVSHSKTTNSTYLKIGRKTATGFKELVGVRVSDHSTAYKKTGLVKNADGTREINILGNKRDFASHVQTALDNLPGIEGREGDGEEVALKEELESTHARLREAAKVIWGDYP